MSGGCWRPSRDGDLPLRIAETRSAPAEVLEALQGRSLSLAGRGSPLDPAVLGERLAAVRTAPHWRRLESLNLSGCGLAALPPQLGALAALTSLDLSSNAFADPLALDPVADPLAKLSRLTTLGLGGMPPLRDLAELSRTQGAQAALAFLRDAHDDPSRSFTLKLVLAGPSGERREPCLRARTDTHGRASCP